MIVIASLIDEPEEITSSTIRPFPDKGLPIRVPTSPCVFLFSIRRKGLSIEKILSNCKDIEDASVMPLYAGPNTK